MSKRDQIIDAALSVMIEGGIDSLTLPALFERARTGSGTFYHHFASRDDLVEAVFEHCYVVAREALVDRDNPELSTPERFSLFIANLFQAYIDNPRQLDFVYRYSYDYVTPAENYVRVIPSLLLLTNIIGAAQREGFAPAAISPMAMARIVRSMVASAYWAHVHGEYEVTEETTRRFARICWQTVCSNGE